jgi:hypothetical protein
MSGIRAVRMTNPEANCEAAGAQGGRYKNTITVYWSVAAGATYISGNLISTYAASQLASYGYAAQQPTKFVGNLVGVEIPKGAALYPTITAAQKAKTGYHVWLRRGYAAGFDYAASGLRTCKSATDNQFWKPTAPIAVDNDFYLVVKKTGATKTHSHRGGLIIHME